MSEQFDKCPNCGADATQYCYPQTLKITGESNNEMQVRCSFCGAVTLIKTDRDPEKLAELYIKLKKAHDDYNNRAREKYFKEHGIVLHADPAIFN